MRYPRVWRIDHGKHSDLSDSFRQTPIAPTISKSVFPPVDATDPSNSGASPLCDRAPLSHDRNRMLVQKPGSQVYFFYKLLVISARTSNRCRDDLWHKSLVRDFSSFPNPSPSRSRPSRLDFATKAWYAVLLLFQIAGHWVLRPHPATKCDKSLVRRFSSLPKRIRLALPDHRLCADPEQHPERSASISKMLLRCVIGAQHWQFG